MKYFYGPGYALATYAGTRTRATGMDLTWSAGLVAKAAVKATTGLGVWKLFQIKGWLKIEASLQAAYKGAYTKIESTQAVATISAGAEIEGNGKDHPYAVQPAGVLVFQNADWTGYEYSYRSADGSSPPGSVAVLQIEPTNVSVISVPYLMNPAHRPVPGMLSSYVLSDDEHQALERRSIIDLGRGTGYLTGSWGYDTKTVATFGTAGSATTKHGFSFELSTLLSAGAEAELLLQKGEAEIGVGIKLALESSWSTTSGHGIEVGSEVWLRGNSKAPNAFVDYSYRMYLLEESSEWTADLLNGLYTDTFPVDPEERTRQQELAASIAADSQPWKVCYSLATHHFNEPLSAVPALTPQWRDRLEAGGVGTTYELSRLLAIVGASEGPELVDPALRPLVDALTAEPEQLAELRSLAGSGPSEPAAR
jgi:hypothetical protein